MAATVSIALGAIIALAGSQGSTTIGTMAVFALCAVLAYVINWVVFIPSSIKQTERYFDLTGSVTYLLITAAAITLSGAPDARSIIVAAMVTVWAIRLGTFLFRRVRSDGGDGRFDEIKVDPLRFFMTWTLQGLWVLITIAAALAILTSELRRDIGWIGIIGIAVWIGGFAIEVASDRQKSAFKKNKANAGRFITSGLWAWSRHPNYFGEILLWTGIAIMAVPILSGWRWMMLISPVFVALLLTKVSGIPMLERRADDRWADQADYQAYKSRTSILVPLPPRD